MFLGCISVTSVTRSELCPKQESHILTKEAEKALKYLNRLYSKYQGKQLTREDFGAIVEDRRLCVLAFVGTPQQTFVERVSMLILEQLERETSGKTVESRYNIEK